MKTRFLLALGLSTLLAAPIAHAELVNFDLAGAIYTKWLYRNNDSQGVLSLGNPFWPDNMSGDNGVGSEFELLLMGRVGDHIESGVRLKSRFGAVWQDWWENGDISFDEVNTSGESLGQNHAQFIKLRGYFVRASLPIPFVDSILVGSQALGMFNEWTIGKIRYIDRDNGKGVFIKGGTDGGEFGYHVGMIALPKLWVGPGWSTGIGDPNIRNPFWSSDWAYGLRFDGVPADGVTLTSVTTITVDSEVDLTDPDAVGSKFPTCEDDLGNPVPGCEPDGAVDTFNRYSNVVSTLEAQIDAWDGGSFNIIGGISWSDIENDLAANGVALNEGVFPLVYDDVFGWFLRARAEFFEVGADELSLKLEYFNVDQHFMTIFGQRREGDVLLTDGFVEGGQLPTLNLANEFIDFDDQWYESIVGWHGATALLEYQGSAVEVSLEGTFVTYNTNAQFRDVDFVYPTFLHSDGYTDTDIYDYANVLDRGRDPRSVFRRHQERMTGLAVLGFKFNTGAGRGLEIGTKHKFIIDTDKRFERDLAPEGIDESLLPQTDPDDDYFGFITTHRVWVSYPIWDGVSFRVGGQFDYWDETNRKGSLEQGYGDDKTVKGKAFLDLRYEFEALTFRYYLEYVNKRAEREREGDRNYNIVRSKAELKVAW